MTPIFKKSIFPVSDFLNRRLFIVSILFLTVQSFGNTAGQMFSAAPFKVTFYWTITADQFPDKDKIKEPFIPVVDQKLKLIGWGPESLVKQIAIEGSGYLPSGQLVNLACNCPYPQSRFFKVDTEKTKWGLDARSQPLIPFQSIAVDPKLIPLGTKVYIPVFKNVELPDGRKHTGCFIAGDIGYGVNREHVDIFSGTKASYQNVVKKLKSDYAEVYPADEKCGLVVN